MSELQAATKSMSVNSDACIYNSMVARENLLEDSYVIVDAACVIIHTRDFIIHQTQNSELPNTRVLRSILFSKNLNDVKDSFYAVSVQIPEWSTQKFGVSSLHY